MFMPAEIINKESLDWFLFVSDGEILSVEQKWPLYKMDRCRDIVTIFLIFYFNIPPISSQVVPVKESITASLFAHFELVTFSIVGVYFGTMAMNTAADIWEKIKIYRIKTNARQHAGGKEK